MSNLIKSADDVRRLGPNADVIAYNFLKIVEHEVCENAFTAKEVSLRIPICRDDAEWDDAYSVIRSTLIDLGYTVFVNDHWVIVGW